MNNKSLVKLSNTIGVISILLLVYWVFTFISISVFGLKVFRENITQTFYLSIVGILALMAGALITNIMFNLTRIAEKHNQDAPSAARLTSGRRTWLFAVSFPLIFVLLYLGDRLSSEKKETMLISSARSVIENNPELTEKLAHYSFDEKWLKEMSNTMELLSKTDKHFPHVSVIVSDTIGRSNAFLGFSEYSHNPNQESLPSKTTFIQPTTKEEREYLQHIFSGKSMETRFIADDGQYQLFYPYSSNGKKMILFFSDYQRYGKFGS